MRKCMWAILFPAVLLAQGPGQGLRQGPAWWEGTWWNSPLVRDLDLSETQRKDIRATVRDFRSHLMDLRAEIQRADGDLETALGESQVDQRKANEAIEHVAGARAELTRTLSQMTLRLRTILTAEQWQELQKRQAERRPPGGRRGPGGRFGPGPAATQQR